MPFTSVNLLLEESIKKNWDRPALSNYQGITLKYCDVARRIEKLHIAFEQCGLNKGDKVAICSRNQANWGVSFLSAITYGAVPVPILHEFKPSNIHHLVNHSEARVLFVDEVVWEGLVIEEMPGLQVVVHINTFKFLYAQTEELWNIRAHLNESFGHKFPADLSPEDLHYYVDSPDELAVINYTSGTSGFSKGVMIPYRAIWSNLIFGFEKFPELRGGESVVSMLPLAHMLGLMFDFLMEMVLGMHVHFLSRTPSPKIIMEAMASIKPRIIVAVPLIIEKIYRSKLKPIIDRNQFFFRLPFVDNILKKMIRKELVSTFGGEFLEIVVGGAAINPEVEKFFRGLEFQFTVGYGMTECAPLISHARFGKARLLSCGQAVPNMEIRIDSEDAHNIPGEVQVRGANVFVGYYKNEAATREAFTEDGWLRTGDMGVMDADGFLYLRGRSKCMILGPSGQNIYHEEIEGFLNNLNYVVESLVIEDSGSLVALIYPDYPKAAQDGMNREAIEKYLTEKIPLVNKELPGYSHIKRFEFMPEDFERTPKRNLKRFIYQRK